MFEASGVILDNRRIQCSSVFFLCCCRLPFKLPEKLQASLRCEHNNRERKDVPEFVSVQENSLPNEGS